MPGRLRSLSLVLMAIVSCAAALWLSGCRNEVRPGDSADPAGREPPQFTNLVVIVLDALRMDHLEAYGYRRDTAPFMSRLADEGIRLRGYSASSWTRTSVTTLLSGLHPERHQTTTRADRLPKSVAYLPALLGDRGYDCRGYTANAMVGRHFGFARGYRDYRQHHGDKHNKPTAAEVSEAAIDLIAGMVPPFFVYLHFLDTHDPYVPSGAWGGKGERADFVQPDDIRKGRQPLTAGVAQQMVDQYDGAIRDMDTEIQRIFEALRDAALLEDTLFVITADHGEEFGEHGGVGHGRTLFEEVIQVPLLLWAEPGLQGNAKYGVFHHVDVLPTVLDALGVEAPENIDGITRWRDLSCGTGRPDEGDLLFSLDLARRNALAVKSSDYKLIHRQGQPTNLLFDVRRDPEEKKNLKDESEIRADLLSSLVNTHNDLAERRADREIVDLTPGLRRQMEALGYLEASTPDEDIRTRGLPDRMEIYDSRVHGLFGHERLEDFEADLDLSERSFQLIDGWFPPDAKGAWSASVATVVLPLPTGDRNQLVLRGVKDDGRKAVRCRVAANGRDLGNFPVDSGDFEIRVPLPPLENEHRLVFVDLEIRPGRRSSGKTARGVYLNRVSIGSSP